MARLRGSGVGGGNESGGSGTCGHVVHGRGRNELQQQRQNRLQQERPHRDQQQPQQREEEEDEVEPKEEEDGAQEGVAAGGRGWAWRLLGKPKAFIGLAGAERLRQYKYSGCDHSPLSRFVFQPFWTKAVLLFPSWMAPNLITFLGLMFVVASFAMSWLLSPTLQEPVPAWASAVFGLFLFLYQTFDAVDGKQARRTSSSSALGEIFDHGCDALVATVEILPFVASLRMGPKRAVAGWLLSTLPFFSATWETFHTHTLRLPVVNGPTEGLMLIYCLFFVAAASGSPWWMDTWDVPSLGMICSRGHASCKVARVDVVMALLAVLLVVPTICSSVGHALEAEASRAKKGADGAGRCVQRAQRQEEKLELRVSGEGEGSLELHRSVDRPLSLQFSLALAVPYFTLALCVVVWAAWSPSDVVCRRPHAFFLPPTFAFGLMAGHLILAHLTAEHGDVIVSMWQPLLLQPLVLLSMLVASAAAPQSLSPTPLGMALLVLPVQVRVMAEATAVAVQSRLQVGMEDVALLVLCTHTGWLYCRFVYGVTSELCSILHVSCFRLKSRMSEEENEKEKAA